MPEITMRGALIVSLVLVMCGHGTRAEPRRDRGRDEVNLERRRSEPSDERLDTGEDIPLLPREDRPYPKEDRPYPKEDRLPPRVGRLELDEDNLGREKPDLEMESTEHGDNSDDDNSISEEDDNYSDKVPFAVWVESAGRRCGGSLVAARSVLTAAWCVSGARSVTVGAAGSVDVTRAGRAILATSGGLVLLELSATLSDTRSIVHAGGRGEAAGCSASCHVTRAVGADRLRALPAPRLNHCPDLLGTHAGTFCVQPVTLCQNDTGTGVTCGGKLCGVVIHSADSVLPPQAAGVHPVQGDHCGDVHEAASLTHWRRFMRCALDERSCHGACVAYCTEHVLDIEDTTRISDKLTPKYHDVSVEGGRSTFHHVYGDTDGSQSYQHAASGGGRPYVGTVAGTSAYPLNAYHPDRDSSVRPQDLPDNPFHRSGGMAIPDPEEESGGDGRRGGDGRVRVRDEDEDDPAIPRRRKTTVPPTMLGELKELGMPRLAAIPSMTNEIPWSESAPATLIADYPDLTSPSPPTLPPLTVITPPSASTQQVPWGGDYDLLSSAHAFSKTAESTTTTPAPSSMQPPTTTTPATTTTTTTTTTSAPTTILTTRRPPSPMSPPPPRPAPAPRRAPPTPTPPPTPSQPPPRHHRPRLQHQTKSPLPPRILDVTPQHSFGDVEKSTEIPQFRYETPKVAGHKNHEFSNHTIRVSEERLVETGVVPRNALDADSASPTLGSHLLMILLAVVLSL